TRTGTPTLTLVLTVSSSRTLPLRVTYVTVFPKRYVRGPALSLSTIVLPGVYSVIVPLPSVVVVVVVVSETCAHANGATTAKAILSSSCFIVLSFFTSFREGEHSRCRSSLDCRKDAPACYTV